MELPTKPIPPERKQPSSLLIYGSPKIGKTTILSQLENNLIIDVERGTEAITALKMQINSLKELKELGREIYKQKKPYSFITLDTISKLEDWCMDEALIKYKKTKQGQDFDGEIVTQLDYGLGYGLVRNEFKSWFNKLKNITPCIIYCAHVKDKYIDNDSTEKAATKDINLTGQLKAIATSNVDAVGFLYQDKEDKNKRYLTFKTSDSITCGNRYKYLEGENFLISEKLENGNIKTYWEKIFSEIKNKN